jgi:phosphoribosylformylglycinamidine synthase
MKACVIVYPGSNCDRDCKVSVERSVGAKVDMVWHEDVALPSDLDLVIIPGGFSYGDYLRCGAMAALSPIMAAVKAFSERGGSVLGICNGFQILCEAGLLPGALLRNEGLKYICKPIELEISNPRTRFTSAFGNQKTAWMTQGNGDGNYFCDSDTLKALEDNDQIVFRYVDNPNGSIADIAGITNKQGNVLGMMPHPDRAFEADLGFADGAKLYESLLQPLLVA